MSFRVFYIICLIFVFCGCNDNTQTPKNSSISNITKDNLPNIVIIVADDLGWYDVGYHKSEIITKNIDLIAKKGTELNRFYAYHSCTPTRVGLMTGQFPGKFGLSHVLFPNVKGGLPESEVTLAEYLSTKGYNRRACIGKWHLGHSSKVFHPLNNGFTYFYGCYGGLVDYFTHKNANELDWHKNYESNYDEGYTTELITKEAVNFIYQSDKTEPFFLYVPYNAPHSPLQAPEEYLNMYGFDKQKPIFSDEGVFPTDSLLYYQKGQGNTERQTYSAMVTAMDDGIGKIYNALKKKGVLNNTFFLFLSDNGGSPEHGASNHPFSGVKGSSKEGGVRVPAVLHYPKVKNAPKIVNSIISYVDIFPTLKEIIEGKTKQEKLDGISFLPTLNKKEISKEHKDRFLYISNASIVRNNLKLVDKQLFDLKEDKKERNNLAEKQESLFRMLNDSLNKFNKKYWKKKKIDKSHTVTPEWEMIY